MRTILAAVAATLLLASSAGAATGVTSTATYSTSASGTTWDGKECQRVTYYDYGTGYPNATNHAQMVFIAQFGFGLPGGVYTTVQWSMQTIGWYAGAWQGYCNTVYRHSYGGHSYEYRLWTTLRWLNDGSYHWNSTYYRRVLRDGVVQSAYNIG